MPEANAPNPRPAPIVRVRGSATLEVEPELVRFTVVVAAQDKDRRLTLERLTRRNDTIRGRIREFGDAVEDMNSGALRVQPVLRDGRGERIRNYHGQVRLHVAMNDFGAMGSLLPELADQELSDVQGPWWRLRPNSEVYVRARSRAVREAVERARVYVEALGAQLTGVVELADVGLSSDQGNAPTQQAMGGGSPMRARGAPPGSAEASPPPLNLEPEQIEVSAKLEATFTMSHPSDL
ncbi:hypothetical protein F4561_004826 [Lipingzhangella halophila]|uniref:SIMPL domain-containing protein n=1 Tax=Lipingzhangella halophila TaxID=1783352 RepID=A0A7W7W4P6_9ACTN|nr:SIMPL domain-containing protein [Lipingzhangella halophila]MBB4934006.1 hypothetical protein [Lipingzhangella halophila]